MNILFVYLNCQVEDGSVSGICHKLASQEHIEVVTQAMARGAFVNPLNPEVFPGVCKMEAEVNNIQDSMNDRWNIYFKDAALFLQTLEYINFR